MTDRKPYSSPELQSLPGGPLSRPPLDCRRPEPISKIAGHDVRDLVERFGSPVYVIDDEKMRAQYRRMIGAFRASWPDTFIGTSVKTNYLSCMVATMREEGAWGEVVSGFEYRLCRDLGIPGNEIIFNGPWKTDDDIRTAFAEGAVVNLDGDDELERVIAIANDMGKEVGVGLRLNMQLNYPPWDKFGFKLENDHALEAARIIAREPNLRLDGLHMHVGTSLPDPALYGRAMSQVVSLALRLERELDAEMKYLDLGGGYATRNTLHDTMLPGEAQSATPEAYAEAVTRPLRQAVSQFKGSPRLFIEPGRILVDESASIITTVRAVKHMAGGQKAALLDAGVHILPTAYWYDHEIRPVEDRGATMENYRMVGPLCMQIDVIRKEINLPALSRDDLLVIENVGAYNFSQSIQFIYMRPAYVMAHANGVDVVRLPEEDDYVRSQERLPSHLINDETRNSVLVRDVT